MKTFIKKNKTILSLFLIFFLFYMILGILHSYNFNIKSAWDYLFSSDTPRIINDFSSIFGNHYRTNVHPLFILVFQPIILLMTGVTQNNMLSIVIFSSFISSLQVVVMYKTLTIINKSKKIAMLLSILFGVSCANIIFSFTIELYNIAGLFLQLLWYETICIIKKDKRVDKTDYYKLIILGVMSLGITVTNYVIFVIISLILLLSKKINLKKIIQINIIIIISFLLLNIFQALVWNNTPLVIGKSGSSQELTKSSVNFNINKEKIKNVIKNSYYNTLIGNKIIIKNEKYIDFNKIYFKNKIIITSIYILLIILIIKNRKKDFLIKLGIVLSLLFNSIFHLIYGNTSVFLYAEHFTYLIFILCGCCLEKETKIKILTMYSLIIYFVINNILTFKQIFLTTQKLYEKNYFANFPIIFNILVITVFYILIITFIYLFLKNLLSLLKKSNKNFINITGLLITLILIIISFISIKTAEHYDTLMGINIYKFKNIELKLTDTNAFEKKYKEEIDYYNEYIKEYKNFIINTKSKLVDINKGDKIYLFGFANRDKIIYNNGKLYNITKKQIIKEWNNISNEIIIPNIYTVLLKLKTGEFIKIQEDNRGVSVNNVLISGTKENIDLYNFNDEKNSEIKKVLYGELLFNINNNIIYQNVITNTNVDYNAFAISAMVLKKTNNIDLISKGIDSIKNLYDSDKKELDNLGELLYLSSLTNNTKLQNLVINEANKIMKNNNTNYLNGTTNDILASKYQSLWYDFGLKAINKHSNINLQLSNDLYSSITWWNGQCNNGIQMNPNYEQPFYTWAQKHCVNSSRTYMNKNIYPITWNKNIKTINYDAMKDLKFKINALNTSYTDSWTSSEILMYIYSIEGK